MNIHSKMSDGKLLLVKKFVYNKSNKAILILPRVGASIKEEFYQCLGQELSVQGEVHLLELRGHKLSQGKYSVDAHWGDMQYWIVKLKKEYKEVFVVAEEMSASLLLQFESQVHTMTKSLRPPIPDGYVLIDPVFESKKYTLPPVRVQTPGIIFVKPQKNIDHLKKIFGTVKTVQANWLLYKRNAVEEAGRLKILEKAVAEVIEMERPIRFKTS